MFSTFNCRRQVDKYDGQNIYVKDNVVYELGNYLGGGASGSVYQAFDTSSPFCEKSVAIKILNPRGYKRQPWDHFKNKCVVLVKGLPLTHEQALNKAPFLQENVWWLLFASTRQIIAAYEDPVRGQLRELTLPKCVEIWGWSPLTDDDFSENNVSSNSVNNNPSVSSSSSSSSRFFLLDQNCILAIEKRNITDRTIKYGQMTINIPKVSPKYIKWLLNRQAVCREMLNMMCVGDHPNVIGLVEVLELLQDSKATLFLVLEFVNGGIAVVLTLISGFVLICGAGELFDRIRSGSVATSEEFCRKYFVQLLSGLQYCHNKGMIWKFRQNNI
jgi:serine/threonine protein kinase